MARQVKQRIDFGDTDMHLPVSDLHDLISWANLPLLNHTEIEARSLMRNQQRGHLWVIHPYADAIADNPRLRHLEQRTTNPIAITNADLIIGKTIDR